jgi:hypothetical protein
MTTVALQATPAAPSQRRPLTSVYCGSRLCGHLMHKGKPALVGRIWGRAELKCPSCRTVGVYEVAG